MSLTAALSSALSGLTVTARRAEVISTNVANATTPGYVRRELAVSSRILGDAGNGVRADGITRLDDPLLTADRRIAGSDAGARDLLADFAARMEAAFGTTEDTGSLSARLNVLEAALIAASGQPSSEARLAAVADAARGLAARFRQASDMVQTARQAADTRLASEVDALNTALSQVHDLNARITAAGMAGRDTAALTDRRAELIDRISGIVPLREVPRENGRVALYTTGGAILLEAGPVRFDVQRTNTITADGGPLSGLRMNGQPVLTSGSGPMAGGTLGALFTARDALGTQTQARLDALALDLASRFAEVDQTGGAGLFTDGGNLVGHESGLSARLMLNALADPARGGALWRLRDGLGAMQPGPPSDGSRLSALSAALATARAPASASLSTGARSLSALTADLLGATTTTRLTTETEASFATARADALTQAASDNGVDTDRELQDLMAVEQAYAANARVIRAMDDLLRLLLES